MTHPAQSLELVSYICVGVNLDCPASLHLDAGYGRAVEVRKESVERTGGRGRQGSLGTAGFGVPRRCAALCGKAVEVSQGHEARRCKVGLGRLGMFWTSWLRVEGDASRGSQGREGRIKV